MPGTGIVMVYKAEIRKHTTAQMIAQTSGSASAWSDMIVFIVSLTRSRIRQKTASQHTWEESPWLGCSLGMPEDGYLHLLKSRRWGDQLIVGGTILQLESCIVYKGESKLSTRIVFIDLCFPALNTFPSAISGFKLLPPDFPAVADCTFEL